MRRREYPVDSGSERLYALVSPVPSFLLGLFASFVSMLVTGVMGERGQGRLTEDGPSIYDSPNDPAR